MSDLLTQEIIAAPPRSVATADAITARIAATPRGMAGTAMLAPFGLCLLVAGPVALADPAMLAPGVAMAVVGVFTCILAGLPWIRLRADRRYAHGLVRTTIATPAHVAGAVDTVDGKYAATLNGNRAQIRRGWVLVIELQDGGIARAQIVGARRLVGGEPAWVLQGLGRAVAWFPSFGTVVCELAPG